MSAPAQLAAEPTKEGHAATREEVFTGLVTEHARFLYKVAFSLLRHAQDAEDAVQDALLKLYRGDGWRGLAAGGAVADARAFWRAWCGVRRWIAGGAARGG